MSTTIIPIRSEQEISELHPNIQKSHPPDEGNVVPNTLRGAAHVKNYATIVAQDHTNSKAMPVLHIALFSYGASHSYN